MGREESKEHAVAEALAQSQENFTNELGQWDKINDNTHECWATKYPKDCQHTNQCLKKAPDDPQASRSNIVAQKPSSCQRICSLNGEKF